MINVHLKVDWRNKVQDIYMCKIDLYTILTKYLLYQYENINLNYLTK